MGAGDWVGFHTCGCGATIYANGVEPFRRCLYRHGEGEAVLAVFAADVRAHDRFALGRFWPRPVTAWIARVHAYEGTRTGV
jgi:hypothetical protein